MLGELEEPVDDFAATGLYEFTQLIGETRLLVAALSRITKEFERDPAGFLIGRSSRDTAPNDPLELPPPWGRGRLSDARRVRRRSGTCHRRAAALVRADLEEHLRQRSADRLRPAERRVPSATAGLNSARIALRPTPTTLEYYAGATGSTWCR